MNILIEIKELKRGPKGIVSVRKYFKEHPIVSFDELHNSIVDPDLDKNELYKVIRYLNEKENLEIKFGLKNFFPESPIYDEKSDVPLNTQIENYYVNEDCIIPLYKFLNS